MIPAREPGQVVFQVSRVGLDRAGSGWESFKILTDQVRSPLADPTHLTREV